MLEAVYIRFQRPKGLNLAFNGQIIPNSSYQVVIENYFCLVMEKMSLHFFIYILYSQIIMYYSVAVIYLK